MSTAVRHSKCRADAELPSRQHMARDLRALAVHLLARTQFDKDAEYRELLGAQFKGIDTKWNELQLVIAWYQDVFTLLPETDQDSLTLRDVLLKARTERLK